MNGKTVDGSRSLRRVCKVFFGDMVYVEGRVEGVCQSVHLVVDGCLCGYNLTLAH